MKLLRPFPVHVLSLSVFFTLLVLINFSYGFGEDSDGFLILGHGLQFDALGYHPTRAWGYPLYDFIVYPLIFFGGVTYAKLYSMILAIASIPIFYRLVLLMTNSFQRAFLAGLCFIIHPLIIINGNAVSETSQGVFLGLLALYSYLKFCESGKNRYLAGLILFAAFAAATRQGYLCLGAGLFFSLLVLKGFSKIKIVLAGLISLLLTVSLYFLVYGLDYYTHGGAALVFLGLESLLRKLGQGFFGYVALLGIPGCFVLFYFIFQKKFSPMGFTFRNPFHLFFILVFFFYSVLFVTLPVKLEYIIFLVPLGILFCSKYLHKEIYIGLLAFVLFLPNIIQIHFFERVHAKIQTTFGFSPGAILQDRSGRLRIEYVTSPEYVALLKQVAEHFRCKKYVGTANNMISEELPERKKCVIVPEERLRFWSANRLPKNIRSEKLFQQKIIVNDLPDNRGWRQFFRFRPWHRLHWTDFKLYEGRGG